MRIDCAGAEPNIDADSVRAALSALCALRASGAVGAIGPLGLDRLDDFRIELCVNGRGDGLAGIDGGLHEHQPLDIGAPVQPNIARSAARLDDRVTRLPHADGLHRYAGELGHRCDPVPPINGSVVG